MSLFITSIIFAANLAMAGPGDLVAKACANEKEGSGAILARIEAEYARAGSSSDTTKAKLIRQREAILATLNGCPSRLAELLNKEPIPDPKAKDFEWNVTGLANRLAYRMGGLADEIDELTAEIATAENEKKPNVPAYRQNANAPSPADLKQQLFAKLEEAQAIQEQNLLLGAAVSEYEPKGSKGFGTHIVELIKWIYFTKIGTSMILLPTVHAVNDLVQHFPGHTPNDIALAFNALLYIDNFALNSRILRTMEQVLNVPNRITSKAGLRSEFKRAIARQATPGSPRAARIASLLARTMPCKPRYRVGPPQRVRVELAETDFGKIIEEEFMAEEEQLEALRATK